MRFSQLLAYPVLKISVQWLQTMGAVILPENLLPSICFLHRNTSYILIYSDENKIQSHNPYLTACGILAVVW